MIIPNALAFWLATEVPFPTLYHTVANLERGWCLAAKGIVAGLVVLMFHLVSNPWPYISSMADSPPRPRQPDHGR